MNTNQQIFTKIICTKPALDYTGPEDEFSETIGNILITVAQKHLTATQETMSDWLTFASVADLCRRHHHTLPRRDYCVREMQSEILALFEGRDSIQRDGVKIRYQSHEEHPQHLRLPKTVHCLRFFRTHL